MSSDSLEGFNIVVSQPALSEDGPRSNKPWKYLSKFQLTCQGYDKVRCTVYANGRQQVPIQINVEARDEDGVIVDVNHAGLYLYLCKYDDIDVFPTELGRTSTEDPLFIYDGTVQGASVDAEASEGMSVASKETERVQKVQQFVTANKVGTYKLAVRCRSPDKVIFVTNTPNPPDGKFDSWLLIDARESKGLPWDSFEISGPHNVVTNSDFDVDLYYIYFKDTNYRIVDTINYRFPNLQRSAHYAWNKGVVRMEHIAFYRWIPREVKHRSCFSADYTATFTVDDRPGQATAARIRDVKGRQCPNYSYQHGLLGYIDQYGNESKVMLRAAPDGNTMSLDNPARANDVEPQADEIDPPSDAAPTPI